MGARPLQLCKSFCLTRERPVTIDNRLFPQVSTEKGLVPVWCRAATPSLYWRRRRHTCEM